MITQRHLTVGLRFGVAVGIAVALPLAMSKKSLIQGVVTFSVVFLIGAFLAAWKQAKGERRLLARGINAPNDMPVRAMVILEVRKSCNYVFEICKSAFDLESLSHVKVRNEHPFQITASSNWASLEGQKITIRVTRVFDDECRVEISSVPRLVTLVVDWGKNYANVWTICSFIRKNIGDSFVISEKLVDLESA